MISESRNLEKVYGLKGKKDEDVKSQNFILLKISIY